jgi:glucosamine--fructose-6-phosphate aminotransferase (isomerizing)
MSKMLAEIREQPAALERTLREGAGACGELARVFAHQRPRLIILAARGTSDNAALFGRYLLEITTGIPVSLAAPSIFTIYGCTVQMQDALVVAISQSGESTDTNLVLQQARDAGAITVGITNESNSTMTRTAAHLLPVGAGRETSVAATKTYTGQLLCLYLLAGALGAPISPDELERMPEWTELALRCEPEVASLAQRYAFMSHAVCLGRGLNYANAFELALKLMETCYVVAERFSPADLLHGPIAMVEASFPIFLFAPPGPTWPGTRDLLEKLSSLGADTLVITNQGTDAAVKGTPRRVVIPANLAAPGGNGPEDLYTPIPYIVPGQLLAAHLAAEKNLDPDQPRTLQKVTRTL